MEFEVYIIGNKKVIVEASDEQDAKQKASELPLKLNDFKWEFDIEEQTE